LTTYIRFGEEEEEGEEMGLNGNNNRKDTPQSQLVIVGTVFLVATLAAVGYFAYLNMGEPEEVIANTNFADDYEDSIDVNGGNIKDSNKNRDGDNKDDIKQSSSSRGRFLFDDDPKSVVQIDPIPDGAVVSF